MKTNWKNILIASTAAAMLTVSAVTGSVAAASVKTPTVANSALKADDCISDTAAKEIALKHAGLSASEVKFYRTKLERDDGEIKYEIEFWKNQTGYEYDVDAVSGEIISYSIDNYALSLKARTGAVIGAEKAKEIALKHAGLTALEAVFTYEKSGYGHGRRVYGIELLYGGNKTYSYEIDAFSGEILSCDYDAKRYTAQNIPDNFIGESKAKEIALKQVGLSAADVETYRIKLDYDDGWARYETEFWNGLTKYEYDIDAVSGEIIGYSVKGYEVLKESQSGAAIGIEKAKEIALKHAGLTAVETVFSYEKTGYEQCRRVYEIKLYSGNNTYSYDIDVVTGKILSYEFDKERESLQNTSGNYISEAEVKKIVEKLAGTSGTFKKLKLESENGTAVYEGKMYSGKTEYEFEIDALTGAVLDWEVDRD